jgi:PAS domain S-box-containing protein
VAKDVLGFRATLARSAALRYVLAPVCIAVALLVEMLTSGPVPEWSQSPPLIHPTGLFQISIVAAAWFGGTGPGLLAAVLATLVLPHLIAMNYPLTAGFLDVPRFLAFAITGLAVGLGTTFRKRAEGALRTARNELEMKVLDQTAELRRSEALLAGAQQLSQTGSFGWKVSKDELVWSEETFRIFGYDRTTKPNVKLALQRVHPDDLALVEQAVERAAKDGEDYEHEYRLLMPDGAVKYVQVAARRVTRESSGVEFVGAVMDVTARKHAEEALRKAQAELAHVARVMTMGEFAASIAHEISQPLGAIVANADAGQRWLAGSTPNLDQARESVGLIMSDANRAADIIKRIRTLIKKADTEKIPLNINDAIREVIALAEGEARRNVVVLRTELAEDLPPVVGDRVQLQQVILNLAMNGIEAMSSVADRPRHLLVCSRRYEPDHLLVALQDVGVGIESESLKKIFDAFYTTKPQGIGMGLAIARSIIENHGGRLWAARNDGPGMTFQFALPAQRGTRDLDRPARVSPTL